MSISIDGFVAGARQSAQHPLGLGAERLHEWMFDPQGEDQAVIDLWQSSPGAYIMGRNMFGPDRQDWDLDWRGWWGDEPPYHTPVFVLSHYRREDLPMAGGTTFHFVTDGIEAALELAHAAAGDKDVAVAGGASTVNQYLAAGLVDELRLHVSPVVLHAGERLFDGVGDLGFEPINVIGSPGVTHITYRLA
jgi:dihydrofolate reductase